MSVILASSLSWKNSKHADNLQCFILDSGFSEKLHSQCMSSSDFVNKHCCCFKCFFEWYNFLVLIVCQDLFLSLFWLWFSVVHEHRMREYSKCRMYQMNMEFRSKMQTKMILRPLPTSVHSNSRGDVKRLVYALPATKKKKNSACFSFHFDLSFRKRDKTDKLYCL